jgi:hypothetical protein
VAPSAEPLPVETKREPPPPVEPPEPEPVALEVTVKGAKDAVILVDGVEWGRGTAIKMMVDPGTHEVVARVKGKPPIKETVKIEAGQEPEEVTLTVPGASGIQRPVRPPRRQTVRPPPPPKSDLWKPKGVK